MNIIKASVEALNEINASNIRIYKTNNHNPLFDYAIVASVSTNRQMNGLISKLNEKSSLYNFDIRGYEGKNNSSWLLVDLNDIIINLFTEEERIRFDLDKMWSNLDEVNPDNFEEIRKS